MADRHVNKANKASERSLAKNEAILGINCTCEQIVLFLIYTRGCDNRGNSENSDMFSRTGNPCTREFYWTVRLPMQTKCNTFSQTRLCFIKSKSKNYVEPTVCKLVVVRTTFARNLVADEAENLKVVLEVVVGAKGLY